MLLSQRMKPKCRRSQCLAHPTSKGQGPHGISSSKEILYCSSSSNHSSQCLVLGGCLCPGRELRAQVWCPKQPSCCWGHASCCSCPAQDYSLPHQGAPQLDDDLSVQCLMAQAAWLARRAPSISLETRSLGTGIDASGSLNINASLGSGNQGEAGGREAMAAGRASLTPLCWHTRQGGTQGHGCALPGWGSRAWDSVKHSGSSFRQGKTRHGENQPAQSLSIMPEVLKGGLCWWGQGSSPGHLPGRLVKACTVTSTWGSQRCLKVTQAALAVTFTGLVLQNEG